MENYFKIIDIIDGIAKSQREATTEEIKIMNELAKKDGENIKQYILILQMQMIVGIVVHGKML